MTKSKPISARITDIVVAALAFAAAGAILAPIALVVAVPFAG